MLLASEDIKQKQNERTNVAACEPVWSSGKAGKHKGLSSLPLRLSLLFKKIVVCGHCPVTLFLTTIETSKWLSSLPILM